MSHDIRAYRVSEEEVEHQYAIFKKQIARQGISDEEWLDAYHEYEVRTQTAYLSRSAFNQVNAIIYAALNAMDCYAGCSGTGESRAFTREQLTEAAKFLDQVNDFAVLRNIRRPKNMADDIFSTLEKMGLEVINARNVPPDVCREVEFVERCIAWLDESGEETITICFS